ncbi:hypothetical protein E2C01_039286 [Portunus trituberculatus]|uniref:Uncharacterized protein n=1 Tax=Portunus trituberculatus TaxID=210409 RepID=A0A5B7FGG1_PORTR|nr:hypothetical protein [Portunus trituberculatus]
MYEENKSRVVNQDEQTTAPTQQLKAAEYSGLYVSPSVFCLLLDSKCKCRICTPAPAFCEGEKRSSRSTRPVLRRGKNWLGGIQTRHVMTEVVWRTEGQHCVSQS